MKARLKVFLGLLLMCIAVSIMATRCGNLRQQNNDLIWLNHHDTVDYVGTATCLQCHNDKHTFLHTGMGMSFDSAVSQKSLADFGTKALVYDSVSDFWYRPFWKEDQLFVEEFRLDGKDTIHRFEQQVSYIFGSGQHTQSHAFLRNGQLFQIPLTWYAQKGTWDLPPGFERGNNSRFERTLDLECVSCHNSLPQMKKGSDRVFFKMEKGIGCERCHGPGELHVYRRSRGLSDTLADGTDPSIVHPGRLSWERQIDLCQRCHLQGLNVLKSGKTFADFRPGMVLGDVFDIFLPLYEGKEGRFDMANHAQRLQKSECFIQSNSGKGQLRLTCITCHNPHLSVKVTGKAVFNEACLQCHQSKGCSLPIQKRNEKDNNCSGCHMPASGTDDIPHVTIHDHWIRKPLKESTKEAATVLAGLYSVNSTSVNDKEMLKAYLLYYEKFDKNPFWLQKASEILKKGGVDDQIHYAYLKKDFVLVRSLSESWLKENQPNAWTEYRLGEAFLEKGEYQNAAFWFERSVKNAPDAFEWKSKLAVSLSGAGRLKEAETHFMAVLKVHPLYPHALNNLAFLKMEQRKWNEARWYLDKCLKAHPDYLPALENALRLYLLLGDKTAAGKTARHILKKYPDHPERVRLKQMSL